MISTPPKTTKSLKWLSILPFVAVIFVLVIYQKRSQTEALLTNKKVRKQQLVKEVNTDTLSIIPTKSVQSSIAGNDSFIKRRNKRVERKLSTDVSPLKENISETIDTNTVSIDDEAASPDAIYILQNFFNTVAKQPTTFNISAQRDTTLYLPEGTIVYIPANTLVYANGILSNGNVLICATEFYDKADMIRSGLSTTSNAGDQLVTGGMLNLTAKDAFGNELNIKNNTAVEVQMPFKTFDKDMQLFLPIKNPQPPTSKADSVLRILQGFDWGTGGQHQAGMPVPMAPVIDWIHTEAYLGGYEGNKLKFIVDKKSTLTNKQVKAALKNQYPGYKIKLARLWKHPFKFFNRKEAPTVGKTDTMPLAKAKRLHLVNTEEETQALLRFQKDLQQYKSDSIRLAATAQVNSNYGFRINSLGFINCDRFYNDPREKTDYYVENANKFPAVHRLFFHNINSVMAPFNGKAAFNKIPVGEKVTLVSVSVINKEPVASFQTFYTSDSNKKLVPDYHPTTPTAFQESLQEFLISKL